MNIHVADNVFRQMNVWKLIFGHSYSPCWDFPLCGENYAVLGFKSKLIWSDDNFCFQLFYICSKALASASGSLLRKWCPGFIAYILFLFYPFHPSISLINLFNR